MLPLAEVQDSFCNTGINNFSIRGLPKVYIETLTEEFSFEGSPKVGVEH